jgi:hypothetical protein
MLDSLRTPGRTTAVGGIISKPFLTGHELLLDLPRSRMGFQ